PGTAGGCASPRKASVERLSITVERGPTEVNVRKRNPATRYAHSNAKPARPRSPAARVRARRRPRLALHAPRAATARRAGPGAEDPRGGAAGDSRRFARHDDRIVSLSARV